VDSERIFQALRAGACGYLLKRSQPEKVIAAIEEAPEGGVPMTPEIARKAIGKFRGQATAAQQVKDLTDRELEVLELVMHGHANKAIAERFGVTVAAIKWHCSRFSKNCTFTPARKRRSNSDRGRVLKSSCLAS